jgi:N,N'-diacetyllegionaminate synthase
MKREFQSTIRLGERAIGAAQPAFVIAEIGVNHNGSLALARDMIKSAADCGVDCVKFQTFRTEEFMASRGVEYRYLSAGRTVVEDMYDMFSRLELPSSWHGELFAYARELGVVPLTSVADPVSVEVAAAAGSIAYKLASEDLINLPLIEHVAAKRKPLLLSTGMADEQEVDDALEVLARQRLSDVVLLHCVSVYPTPDDEVRLERMLSLSRKTGALVGYSDHSTGITASVAAVALGACVIEKHFTTDRGLEGPDQALSADPEEMKALVTEIRRVERMRGAPAEPITPSLTERVMRASFRRCIVAAETLEAGTAISKDNVRLQRSGVEGVRYRDLKLLLGRRLRRQIPKSAPIQLSDVV